jgi:hypothetical protein
MQHQPSSWPETLVHQDCLHLGLIQQLPIWMVAMVAAMVQDHWFDQIALQHC